MGYLSRLMGIAPPAPQQTTNDYLDPVWFGLDGSVPIAITDENTESKPPSNIATVAAIIKTISGSCGALPRRIYPDDPSDRTQIRDERYRYLTGRPNSEQSMSGNAFWEAVFASMEGWGNVYIWLDRIGAGWRGVTGMYFMMPQRFTPYLDGNKTRYKIRDDTVKSRGRDEILHMAHHMYDGVEGMAPAKAGRLTHQLALSAEHAAKNYFTHGATVGSVVTSPDKMQMPQIREFYDEFDKFHAGARNTGRPLLMQGNMKYEQIGIPPNEAQFLETRQFEREEILSWYAPGLPHHLLGWKSGASQWGTGVEAQGIAYVTYVLLPRLSLVEEVITEEFLEPGLQFEFDVAALLRGDMKARAEVYTKMRQQGTLSADQWRGKEGMAPRGIPDDYLHQLNQIRIDAKTGKDISNDSDQDALVPTAPPAIAAQSFRLDELRCGNDKCPSRAGGRRGALLATKIGDGTVMCHQCEETTTVSPDKTVRDSKDMAEALGIELMRRLS